MFISIFLAPFKGIKLILRASGYNTTSHAKDFCFELTEVRGVLPLLFPFEGTCELGRNLNQQKATLGLFLLALIAGKLSTVRSAFSKNQF